MPSPPTSGLPGPAERRAAEQRILNARPLPPRHLQQLGRATIRVVVRLEWEQDGEEMVATRARDWVGRDVLIDMDDRRWPDARGLARRRRR